MGRLVLVLTCAFSIPRTSRRWSIPAIERAWMPVDLYVGGAEHAVLHLLYARFWHKVLFDRGHVSTPEPFRRLVNQGMILGEMEITGYQAGRRQLGQRRAGRLPRRRGQADPQSDRRAAARRSSAAGRAGAKAGRRLGAGRRTGSPARQPCPQDVEKPRQRGQSRTKWSAEYGADSLRLFEMFMGPLEATKPWSMEGVNGVRGFLDRVWRMIVNERSETLELNPAVQDVAPTVEQDRVLHRTIQAVTQDIERMAFNTAIAKMMEFTNFFTEVRVASARGDGDVWCCCFRPLPRTWPKSCGSLLGPRQDAGLRALARVRRGQDSRRHGRDSGADQRQAAQPRDRVRSVEADELEQAALADPRVAELLAGKTLVKKIIVPAKR